MKNRNARPSRADIAAALRHMALLYGDEKKTATLQSGREENRRPHSSTNDRGPATRHGSDFALEPDLDLNLINGAIGMPKIGDLIPSKYLKKEDFPEPAVLTVVDVKKMDVSIPGEPAKEKGVMFFKERDKGLILNVVNVKRAARIFKSDDYDQWPGKRVIVYTDESVEFAGEVIGGIRLREPGPIKKGAGREREKPANTHNHTAS